jgi:hypothetical protein
MDDKKPWDDCFYLGQCSHTTLPAWAEPEPEPLLREGYEETAEMPDLRREDSPQAFADLAAARVRRVNFEKKSDEEGAVELGDAERDMMRELRILTGLESAKSLKQESNLVDRLVESPPKRKKLKKKRMDSWTEATKANDPDLFDGKLPPPPAEPTRPILEQYKECAEGTVRREWANKAEKGELQSSGMPTYMQMITEGKEDQYDEEMLKYCKLAGLKYVTTKEKMRKEVEDIKNKLFQALWDAEKRLDKLVESFKQMEVD